MKVVLFGATGMIGRGALRECLLDPDVTAVVAVGRSATGQQHPKLRELVVRDLFDLSSVAGNLDGADACFYCIGITAAGTSEADYRRVTYDLALSVTRALVTRNPGLTLVHVSAAGASTAGRGPAWARVKGETEGAVLKLPFKDVYVLRPFLVQPLHGITSRTGWYRAFYAAFAPFAPIWKAVLPGYVTTTERVGKAMLILARRGAPKRLLDTGDINRLVREHSIA